MVDRYLASPAYGERMAMDWLDLARYADTYGYQADVERDMSPIATGSSRAFNRNLPYDQFLTWQLAGDLLPNATREQRIATAFNRLHRQTNEGGSIEEEFRTEYVADRVNTFGTAMLGLTLECARCHDHKFDPITQRDYYSLFAFFNNIDESGLYSHFTNATPTPVAAAVAAATSRRNTSAWRQQIARDRGAARQRLRRVREGGVRRRARSRGDDAAGADRPSGLRHGRRATRRRTRSRNAGANCRTAPVTMPTERRPRAAVQRRQLGRASWRADFSAHRPVLACASASSRPSRRTAPSSCTSRAHGPTPAAAASS